VVAKGTSSTAALEFDAVTLGPTWPYDTALEGASFAIRPGELALLTLAPGRVRSPFADLAQALIHPHGGAVRFRGESWRELSPRQTAKARARLGRVFDVGGWISNLDMDENVLLAQRHHNAAPAEVLRRRGDELARAFGLDGLPRKRPAEASQYELRLSQWVRALLVDMDVLVLERPVRDVLPEAVPKFLGELARARERGAAVLWVTTDGASATTPNNVAPPDVTAKYAIRGTSLVKFEI
jgi:ABC-type lipoprotein export system ATPase subunit